MSNLPPFDFYDRDVWWARQSIAWNRYELGWANRPTERRALLRMMLKNWALHDGHYWDWLSSDEQQLHILEMWLRRYQPHLVGAWARARWIQQMCYAHLSVGYILAVWEMTEEVLCGYASQMLTLRGMMNDEWEAYIAQLKQHQSEAEHTALPHLAFDEHAPAVLFDDGLDDG